MKRKKEELLGIACVLGALYLAVSLFSYSRWDPSFFTYSTFAVKNYGGRVGAYLSDLLISMLGASAFLVPFFAIYFGLRKLFMEGEEMLFQIIGSALFVLSICLFLGLTGIVLPLTGWNAGGMMGSVAAGFVTGLVSPVGGYIFVALILISSIILVSPVPVTHLLSRREKEEAGPEEPAKAGPELPETAVDLEDDPVEAPAIVVDNDIFGPEGMEGPEIPAPASKKPSGGAYELPPVELLSANQPVQVEKPDREELLAGTALLERKLKDFGIQGKVAQVQAGPVVTMYEFEPAPGVKIQKVISLSEDLSLSMKAQSVRIAPIPGKAALGIEIPNRQRETVLLREIISSDAFRKNPSRLTLALGKDIFGCPISADLTRMPHLLVAGATGAGKSVCLNSMVASLLYKASPRDVKMLMIDPKLLELSAYEKIPHLISPVVTGPKAASEALKKMVFEMERRYRVIAEKGAKGIESFNKIAPEEERLPYIVVVIDELADLMLSSAAEVEDSIARLAQMARASGIHLIVATQRPSVDVITGVIKANFPTRISFQVASRIDSRTILDSQGAEQLIGRGDMLLLSPGTRLLRIHGAFISEQEIKALSDFVRAQGDPDYALFESIKEPESEEPGVTAGGRDELYEKAIDAAAAMGEVSISYLQRRLKVGFNRAARIMELMEEDGLVGPPKGAGKPRAFLGRRNFN